MIKINKNLNDIPTSLKPPTDDYFPFPVRPPVQSRTTHLRRREVIAAGEYINERKYNDRYKYQDVKEALNALYHKKCGFCEVSSDYLHVEHFRPKKMYFWLAYSWDNLLLACHFCNANKGSRFEVGRERYSFNFDIENTYKNIHTSRMELDKTEQPLLVNPEVEDLSSELIFDRKGGVTSDHPRIAHTIKECDLSRNDLKYRRKKILDDFKSDIRSVLLEYKDDRQGQTVAIKTLVKQFLRRANCSNSSFLAFRQYAISKKWIQLGM